MTTQLKNDRLLKALRCETVDCVPVWIMRQAGRYLPEYRATRKRAGDFLSLCKNPDLACEVALQPLKRFDLDAAILFSDILTIPDAMGLGLYFETGEGPKFRKTLRTEQDLAALALPDCHRDLAYVMAAVKSIHQALAGQVPLIGFSGSPWTLATYMVEGESTKTFHHVKGMLYRSPALMHALLDLLTNTVTEYLIAQIDSGAQVLQIFDTWGGVLSGDAFVEFSLRYMQKIVQTVKQAHPEVPIILFTKGGALWLQLLAATGASGLGLDWTVSLCDARRRVGNAVALQGNLDPCVLYSDRATIVREVEKILRQNSGKSGFIFNLGHGVQPQVNPDAVKVLVDTVHEFSA